MMTNREKYPKTEDALAAFKKHKEDCKCDCTFDKWLGQLCGEEIEKAIKDMPAGLSIMGMLVTSISAKYKKGAENYGIECPVCHKKNGHFQGMLMPHFMCPDCDAIITNREIESDHDAFVKWFSQFSKKQD